MSKKAKIILAVAAGLLIVLAGVFCLEYFVLQSPVFDRSGWHTTDTGAVQYRDYYAKPLTGWQKINGKQYHFGDNGTMRIGWLVLEDNTRYYFDSDGAMHTGWLEESGNRYYLTEEGTFYTGWLEEGGKRYYLTERGAAQIGWLEQDGKRWCFGADGSMLTGWAELEDGTYLLDDQGHPRTGWVEVDGLRYYLDETGLRNEYWQDTAEGLTYLVDGERLTGWLNAPEGKFYFNDNGIAHTGWVTDETGRFYLYGDGSFATGFVEIEGVQRYFLPTGEYVILCNRWNPIPEDYAMNLVSIGKFKMDATCAGAMETMIAAAKEDGVTLKINNTYRSKKTQQSMWETRRVKYMGQGMTLAEADAYIGRSVAVPGTSEHQTGLAADIKGSQKVYTWLAEHSWEYGFILRYPDDKIDITGIIYEPWHFRYVGKEMAKAVYDSGLCLEEYFEMLKKQ